jgi:hypothetical protein
MDTWGTRAMAVVGLCVLLSSRAVNSSEDDDPGTAETYRETS